MLRNMWRGKGSIPAFWLGSNSVGYRLFVFRHTLMLLSRQYIIFYSTWSTIPVLFWPILRVCAMWRIAPINFFGHFGTNIIISYHHIKWDNANRPPEVLNYDGKNERRRFFSSFLFFCFSFFVVPLVSFKWLSLLNSVKLLSKMNGGETESEREK